MFLIIIDYLVIAEVDISLLGDHYVQIYRKIFNFLTQRNIFVRFYIVAS